LDKSRGSGDHVYVSNLSGTKNPGQGVESVKAGS